MKIKMWVSANRKGKRRNVGLFMETLREMLGCERRDPFGEMRAFYRAERAACYPRNDTGVRICQQLECDEPLADQNIDNGAYDFCPKHGAELKAIRDKHAYENNNCYMPRESMEEYVWLQNTTLGRRGHILAVVNYCQLKQTAFSVPLPAYL